MSDKKQNVITGGTVLITLGILIYLSKSGSFPFGQTWPVLLIVIGICTLLQKFRDLGGWIITLAGTGFLLRHREDHSRAVRELAARLVWAGILSCEAWAPFRRGYALWVSGKPGSPGPG